MAKGEARAGVSDVDVILVAWDHESSASVARAAGRKRQLRRRVAEEWTPRWRHLATKADVRVAVVPPPPHPAGAALAAAIAGEPLDRQPRERADALVECLGAENAFALAAESVTLRGPDLPTMFPRRARVPPARCLPTLHADVVEALADGGENALRWALRRCVRAAFELEMAKAAGEVCDAEDAEKGGDVVRGAYTRDLYHCAALVADARPELGEDLAAALVAAVHGPRAVWGALWYACGSALCARLKDATD